jgi:hypothetical protein
MKFSELREGVRVRIKQPFKDYDGQAVEPGVRVVVSHDVFFYYGGHTLKFTDGSVIRLCGDVPEDDRIMEAAVDEYWEILPSDAG